MTSETHLAPSISLDPTSWTNAHSPQVEDQFLYKAGILLALTLSMTCLEELRLTESAAGPSPHGLSGHLMLLNWDTWLLRVQLTNEMNNI